MRLNKLSELNNFQDAIILCKIFENRGIEMMQRFPYNPRKCTSASSLIVCIHRLLSKAIIALPTRAEIVDLLNNHLSGDLAALIQG